MARRTVNCSLGATVAAALLSLAVATPVPAQDLGTDRRLFVIGDSVMVGAQSAVVSALPSWQVTVVADVGLSLLGSASIVRERRGEIGEVAVVELGANDGLDPAVFRERVDAMMDALAGVPLVLWVDQPAFEAGRAALDAQLDAAAAAHPNLRVIDWSAQVASRPDYVGPDGLHLSAAGAQALTNAIGAELLRWVDEQTRPPPVFSVVGPYVHVVVHQVAVTAPS
jgi:lysophospholipase L1-like esterase